MSSTLVSTVASFLALASCVAQDPVTQSLFPAAEGVDVSMHEYHEEMLAAFNENFTQTGLQYLSPNEQGKPARVCTMQRAKRKKGGLRLRGNAAEKVDEFIAQIMPVVQQWGLTPAAPGSTEKVAVIIEPRDNGCWEFVLRNVMHFLGESWALQIFSSTNTINTLKAQFAPEGSESTILFTNLGRENFNSFAEYNSFLLSPEFWNQVQGEKVLMFQLDSFLLRPGMDAFLEFDYVGAPWSWCESPWCKNAGNGGLSMRSKKMMLKVLEHYPATKYNLEQSASPSKNEDEYFVDYIQKPEISGKLAPMYMAQKFAVETVPFKNAFGVHAAWKWLDPPVLEEMLQIMMTWK